jgi:hypothetical protein
MVPSGSAVVDVRERLRHVQGLVVVSEAVAAAAAARVKHVLKAVAVAVADAIVRVVALVDVRQQQMCKRRSPVTMPSLHQLPVREARRSVHVSAGGLGPIVRGGSVPSLIVHRLIVPRASGISLIVNATTGADRVQALCRTV